MAEIAVVDLLTVVVIVALYFVAGLFAQTRTGRMLGDLLECAVLGRVPGFTFLKSMTRGQCFKSGDNASYRFDLQGVISIYIHV